MADSIDSNLKENLREDIIRAGALCAGYAAAGKIPDNVVEGFKEWLEKGFHAGMTFLERHNQLRKHTDNVLPGAKTIISMAFAYKLENKSLPYATHIASYALGKDYHDSLKQKLFPIVEKYKAKLGGEWRICIDSAPIAERYWASKAGIGKIGKNGCIIVDEGGSAVFLAEILTTLYFEPDLKESYESYQGRVNCRECGRCVESCPTGALSENGRIDSNRCISYLTIEKRGEWTPEEKEIMELPESSKILFGCDICVKCCPMNGIPDRYYVEDDDIYQELKEITEEDILNLSKPDFKKKFGKTPLFRATYEGIVRNALNVKKSKSNK